MNKALLGGLLFLFTIVSCKKEIPNNKDITVEFTLLENYYEEGLELDPMKATRAGDSRFNDKFPNFLSEEFKTKKKSLLH